MTQQGTIEPAGRRIAGVVAGAVLTAVLVAAVVAANLGLGVQPTGRGILHPPTPSVSAVAIER